MRPLNWHIEHEGQLSGSVAEPLALALSAELAARGFIRSQTHNWDDKVAFARAEDGRVIGVICWRLNKWNRAAVINLGGVIADFRRQGVYRALFESLVAEISNDHEEVEQIDSGHHVRNTESAAVHKALGRKLDGLSYSFRIGQPPVADGPQTATGAMEAIEPEWQAEAFAFLYGLIGGAPATAANVIRMNPEVRARLHRAIYERRPREESYDAMMARLLPNGLPLEAEA